MRTRSAERLRKADAPTDAGEIAGAIGLARAVRRMHPEKPQDAQVILGDALAGVADEAHAPFGDIGKAADMVVHDAVGVDGKAVDGEVAPFGVANPVAAEGDPGLAAESLGILAQRRNLERMPVDNQRHGAVLDAGRHRFDAGRLGATDHLIGKGGGRDIDIAGRDFQKVCGRRRRAPSATTSFNISMRTRSADRFASPARPPMQAR